jgi:hypothetical protein
MKITLSRTNCHINIQHEYPENSSAFILNTQKKMPRQFSYFGCYNMKGDIVYLEDRKINAEQEDFLYPDVNNR